MDSNFGFIEACVFRSITSSLNLECPQEQNVDPGLKEDEKPSTKMCESGNLEVSIGECITLTIRPTSDLV